jgi:hypothetical protein
MQIEEPKETPDAESFVSLQERYGRVAIDVWRIAFNRYRAGATSDEAKSYARQLARQLARRQAHHWGLTLFQIECVYRMAFVHYPDEDTH